MRRQGLIPLLRYLPVSDERLRDQNQETANRGPSPPTLMEHIYTRLVIHPRKQPHHEPDLRPLRGGRPPRGLQEDHRVTPVLTGGRIRGQVQRHALLHHKAPPQGPRYHRAPGEGRRCHRAKREDSTLTNPPHRGQAPSVEEITAGSSYEYHHI